MSTEPNSKTVDLNLTLNDLDYEFQNWVHEFIHNLTPSRRERVLEFLQEMELAGRSKSTVSRYLEAIRKLGVDGKPYEELDREDLIEWMRNLPYMKKEGDGKYSEQSVNLMKRFCKRFLRFCHTGEIYLDKVDEYPEVIECIQYDEMENKLPKDILSKDEIKDIVEVCQNQRNRAMIFTLYESGCRLGEFLGLELGDIEFDQHGATIMVDGKTGSRRIRLVESVPDLQLWINMHSHKGERDAPVCLSREGDKEPLSKTQFRDLIVQRAEKAGIEKRVYPHLFRHSRATHLANVLTEAQMREYFGWSKNSDVPSRYVHLSGRDVDDTLLDHYGVDNKDTEEKDEHLKPKECSRCGSENPVESKYCNECGMTLDDRAAMEIDKKRRQADDIQKMFNEWILDNKEDLLREFINRPKVRKTLRKISNHQSQ